MQKLFKTKLALLAASLIVAASLLVLPNIALASSHLPASCYTKSGTGQGIECAGKNQRSNLTGQGGILTNIIILLISITGMASVIMIIIGGFRYIFSQGEDKNVQSAKKTILYSVVGLVVSIMSFAIINYALDILNTGSVTNNTGNNSDPKSGNGNSNDPTAPSDPKSGNPPPTDVIGGLTANCTNFTVTKTTVTTGEVFGSSVSMLNNGPGVFSSSVGVLLVDLGGVFKMTGNTLDKDYGANATATFNLTLTAPSTSGTYVFQPSMGLALNPGHYNYPCQPKTISVIAATVDPITGYTILGGLTANCTNFTVTKTTVTTGEVFGSSVSMLNNGPGVFSPSVAIALFDPAGIWTMTGGNLDKDYSTGQTATFTLGLKAPSTPGTYVFQPYMGVVFTGFYNYPCVAKTITVVAPTTPPPTTPPPPTDVIAGLTANCTNFTVTKTTVTTGEVFGSSVSMLNNGPGVFSSSVGVLLVDLGGVFKMTGNSLTSNYGANATATFNLTLTAPSTSGTYVFQPSMGLALNPGHYNYPCVAKTITVVAPTTPPPPTTPPFRVSIGDLAACGSKLGDGTANNTNDWIGWGVDGRTQATLEANPWFEVWERTTLVQRFEANTSKRWFNDFLVSSGWPVNVYGSYNVEAGVGSPVAAALRNDHLQHTVSIRIGGIEIRTVTFTCTS